MRTTLDIDDALLSKARIMAAKEHTSLTRLIEEGLAIRLRPHKVRSGRRRDSLPIYPGNGGLHERVTDTLSHRALLDAADGL